MTVLAFGEIPGEPTLIPRWKAGGFPILIGGPVVSAADWVGLSSGLGVGHVICLTDPPDVGVPEGMLTHAPRADDGEPFNAEHLERITKAANEWIERDSLLYVHCWIGRSRSPSAAYAILRAVLGVSEACATATLNHSSPWGGWLVGENQLAYKASIDRWLAERKTE